MALDNAVLALTAQPPKLEDPIQAYQKLLGVQQAKQQQVLTQQEIQGRDLENQQRAQQYHQQQVINQAYSKNYKVDPATGEASMDMSGMAKDLSLGGAGSALPSISESITKAQKAKSDLIEQQGKIKSSEADYLGHSAYGIMKSGGDPTLAVATLQDAYNTYKDPQILQGIQAIKSNPTPQNVQAILSPFIAKSPGAQEVIQKEQTSDAAALTAKTKAETEAREQGIAALKKPVLEAEATQATAAQSANKLSKATNLADYTRQWDALPADQKAVIPNPTSFSRFSNAERFKVLKAGTTPEQQVAAGQRDEQISQTDQLRSIEQQNANTNAARLALKQNESASGATIKDLDREAPRFAKPYEKMMADGNAQLDKIAEAKSLINGGATGQALGIPKVLSAVVGGAGSGLRMTTAELNAIGRARGVTGDVQGWINKVTGQGTLTPDQQKQLNGVLDDVSNKLKGKQSIVNDALDAIQGAGSRDRIIEADRNTRKKLIDYENNGGKGAPAAGSAIVQHSASTGAYRFSTDGGKTWQAGQPK